MNYDKAGNLSDTQHPSGRHEVIAYDDANRRTSQVDTLAAETESLRWIWDDPTPGRHGLGRLGTTVVLVNGEKKDITTYAYDRRGLVTDETHTIADTTYSMAFDYDDNGNETDISLPSVGTELRFVYDDTDRISDVKYDLGAGKVLLAGSVSHRPYGPVTGYSRGDDTVTRTFDERDRLTGLQLTNTTAGTIFDRSYTRADGQNISAWSDAGRSFTFGYDNLSRLLTADESIASYTWAYTYDGIGNRLTKTVTGSAPESWTYEYPTNGSGGNDPKLRALATTGGPKNRVKVERRAALRLPVRHDEDGAMTFVGKAHVLMGYSPRLRLASHVERGIPSTFGYDARGYLSHMTRAGDSEFADARFLYDHRGRLLAILHGASSSDEDRAYVWLGDQPLAEITPTYATPAWWIVGDHIGSPALQYGDSTNYRLPHFAPFGELMTMDSVGAGPFPALDLRFPGQVDLSAGASVLPLYYNIHRYYVGDFGRYSRADPIGHRSRPENVFPYAANNPLNSIDLLGLTVKKCCGPPRVPALERLGIPHCWLKTDTKEAGLGPAGGGVPGDNGSDCVCTPTAVNDHSGRSRDPDVVCVDIPTANEDCVNRLLANDTNRGPWIPGVNDCWTFVDDVLKDCGGKWDPTDELEPGPDPTCPTPWLKPLPGQR